MLIDKEFFAGVVAIMLTAIMGFLCVVFALSYVWHQDPNAVTYILTVLSAFNPIIGLMLGYYFGSKEGS
jgi:uncharacterized BrkB/YihY/UPF0761 family membrane protein